MRQGRKQQNSDDPLAGTPTTEIQPQGPVLKQLHDGEQSLVSEPVKVEREDRSLKGGATGPRSELGKQRSSRNAIKHGIFSEVTVLPGESGARYRSLWEGLL